MSNLITITLLTLLLLTPQSTSKIVTCTVIEPGKSVACPQAKQMDLITLTDPDEARVAFNEWSLSAPVQSGRVNGDAPLFSVEVKAGDKVKADVANGKFKPVANCDVRVWRNVKAWRANGHEGEIPPNSLFTQPDDCQPWHGSK